jgi:hypothetical protein
VSERSEPESDVENETPEREQTLNNRSSGTIEGKSIEGERKRVRKRREEAFALRKQGEDTKIWESVCNEFVVDHFYCDAVLSVTDQERRIAILWAKHFPGYAERRLAQMKATADACRAGEDSDDNEQEHDPLPFPPTNQLRAVSPCMAWSLICRSNNGCGTSITT